MTEHRPLRLVKNELGDDEGEEIWRCHDRHVHVEFPSPRTDGCWELRSEGWIGYLPLQSGLVLNLKPKVPLANVFRMLEYAYQTRLQFSSGITPAGSLAEFFERVALVFAQKVSKRARRGLYKTYLSELDRLVALRGRLDLNERVRSPWSVPVPCAFEENTHDVEDNQILAWTLSKIARCGLSSPRVRPNVRRAYHALTSVVSLTPINASACVGRQYNRLNDDYRELHALSRFFLENTGPRHSPGEHGMLPFLVEMSPLFEMFVAEWLQKNMPAGWALKFQEPLRIGINSGLDFRIDMVVYETNGWTPKFVLDAKYKAPQKVDQADFNQVVVYAKAKGCNEALLVYPVALLEPLDVTLHDVRIRSVTFDLGGDLEVSGLQVIEALLPSD